MQNLRVRLTNATLFATSVASLLLMQGCSNSMHDDEASNDMNGGISKTRDGLEVVGAGIDASEAGDTATGMAHIDAGMGMMTDGMNRMASGMNKMPEGMMMSCCQGSQGMMTAMQQAMQHIRDGRDMLNDATADNDAEGFAELQTGANAMAATLDDADESMGCMGRSSSSMM